MALTYDEMEEAVRDAQFTVRRFEEQISSMANLIAGKLKSGHVGAYTLRRLKKELKNYNMTIGCWKD